MKPEINFSFLTKEYKKGKEVVFVKMKSQYHDDITYLSVKEKIGTDKMIVLIDLQMQNNKYPIFSLDNIDFELNEYLIRKFHCFLNEFLPFTNSSK